MGAEVREGTASTDPIITTSETAVVRPERVSDQEESVSLGAPEMTQFETSSQEHVGATVIDLRSGDPVIRLEPAAPIRSRAASPYARVVKPVVDRILGVVALTLASPILFAVALGIRVTMGRGVLFRQPRVGRDGRVFDVMKFRTMSHDRRGDETTYVGPERRYNHKSIDDPRHTPFGRFLRKWSLDEFPQFLNVVRGDMSMVGPRPELVSVVEKYQPWQHDRHQVRPGITGIWQVSERNDVPLHEATHLDIEYIETVSLLTDMRIMARTLPAMLGRSQGA